MSWSHRRIQHTNHMDLGTAIREINDRFRQGARSVSENFSRSLIAPTSISANGSHLLLFSPARYAIESIYVKTSSGTAGVTLEIDGIGAPFVGAPVTGTATPAFHEVLDKPEVPAGSSVEITVSGLTGTLFIVPQVRRVI